MESSSLEHSVPFETRVLPPANMQQTDNSPASSEDGGIESVLLGLATVTQSHTVSFLPSAKRQGQAELWVEKKESYGFLIIETSVNCVFWYVSILFWTFMKSNSIF